MSKYVYLDEINNINDIKKIPHDKYPVLAQEIRNFLVENVSKTGGHLASNLGVVELTMALHLVLNLPKDKIVWDVGHQAYTHKILTGRKDDFTTLRCFEGLSGFPKRNESEADSFDTGHSSTSISAALGIATANKLNGNDDKVVAVIGDGALTGGLAFEALNNVAALKRNFVIVLNDNNMSIAENVGGMSKYLNKIRVGEHYNEFKVDVEHLLKGIPKIGDNLSAGVKRVKDNFKQFFVHAKFFDDMGVTYIGPVDGHNIDELIRITEDALKIEHPVLIHVLTKKGKGYLPAENNPTKFHGIDSFDVKTGEKINESNVKTYTDIFSDKILELGNENKNIVAITAAMPDGTGLKKFGDKYPDKFFDVGIAEEHAVTFAAGLAANGKKPFISIYSSFYQRAYDQIIHDVCLQNLPVTFIIDRAGLVGKDGETHQGIFDISFFSNIPNMTIIAPKNGRELEKALEFAQKYSGPIAIRFSRGKASNVFENLNNELVMGKSETLIEGKHVAIIAVGNIIEETYNAVKSLNDKGCNPTLINALFLKPFDKEMIDSIAKKYKYIVTIEEGIRHGGYGEAVISYMADKNYKNDVMNLAIEDEFVEQGTVEELRKKLQLDADSICERILNFIK
ncbi:1-deoxy-D-xylulose-5-phosphate synthase [Eubacterium sp.]|uniref:1-deoxy-D-xylulose-5-phosphate synthase n=1 Tax=Eubacterium sp. TaxID=142586 RepID=UPI003520B72A